METKTYHGSSSHPASCERAVRAIVHAAEGMHRQHAIDQNIPPMVEVKADKTPISAPVDINAPGNWIMRSDGQWVNTITGEIADEPKQYLPSPITEEAVEEEETGFHLPDELYVQGVRLAIGSKTGLIRRCPECGERRLVHVHHEGTRYLACANGLTADPRCDFKREDPKKD